MTVVTGTLKVEVQWDPVPSNAFIVGESTMAPLGTDVITDGFSADFGGSNDDISGDVETVEISRGRDDPLATLAAGTATITLAGDTDQKYNPRNTSSPIYGFMRPMRHVRITVTYDSTDYVIFRGFIREISYSVDGYSCTIFAEDMFLWLSRIRPEVGTKVNNTTGQLIKEILDAVGWDNSGFVDVDISEGEVTPSFSLAGTAESRTALEAIQDLLTVERGLFFVSSDGKATYDDRDSRNALSVGTLEDVAYDLTPGVGIDAIKNVARVKKEGEAFTVQEARDGASVDLYGPNTITITSPYFRDDVHALDLAVYLVEQLADPTDPLWALPILANHDDSTYTLALGLDINERVTLDSPHNGMDGDFHIETITHVFERGAAHRMSLGLTAAKVDTASAWRLDISEFDSTDEML